MPTKMQSFRLTDEAIARLARLVAADPGGASQAEIIAEALYEYETSRGPLAQRLLLEIYSRVGHATQTLEAHRDFGDGIDADAAEVLEFLNRVWDEARTLKLFTEPSLPPEPWEK